MTAQASDIVIYNDNKLHLAAYSDGEPFDPIKYGYRPVAASTACWRGYLCEYTIKDGQLFLDKLYINHQASDYPVSQLKNPPNLNGSTASHSTQSFIGKWLFENINLSLDYTGGLIIAQGFIQNLYVHMGFHPAWKYEEVYELVFESGKLKSEFNLSLKMTEVRKKIEQESARKSEKPSRETTEAWIDECFLRDYRRSS